MHPNIWKIPKQNVAPDPPHKFPSHSLSPSTQSKVKVLCPSPSPSPQVQAQVQAFHSSIFIYTYYVLSFVPYGLRALPVVAVA